MRATGFLFVALTLTLGCDNDSPVEPVGNPSGGKPQPTNLGSIAIAGFDGIRLIHLDSGVTHLTTEGRNPSWSPDGKRLVYSTTRCETDWETYYKCGSGGLVFLDMDTRISTVPPAGFIGEDPAWSPLATRSSFHDIPLWGIDFL